ncbi:meiosis protein SPO22/ZIP4 like-domain-containing protein [Crepidotus variabilis]|uniref:Protein ZIP4 homolog n=1 Tax=Crepidotus variabilis TaxID=179855 RepID=A0A9P6EF61_9AGAR|nr:meiosis protein SPO22/ZIP4 like-domain-containing protein [Crepidotus variabilis]
MTGHSKKSNENIMAVHSLLSDRVSRCKTMLDDHANKDWTQLTQELYKIGTLAETFTELRLSSQKESWTDLVDFLDQEGVNLWNISGIIHKSPSGTQHMRIAALRFAAFRLIEAGLEAKPGLDTLIHVLQLANKTGAGLIEAGKAAVASSILKSAANYEESLRNRKWTDDTQRRAVASARLVFYSVRMEAAWTEGNHSLAVYLSEKIAEDSAHLNEISPSALEALIVQFHTFGRSLLKGGSSEGPRSSDAIQWLQKAFAMADTMESKTSDLSALKISVLRTMARAHFLAQSYDQAESVLDELVPIIDSIGDAANTDYHELRWLRLAVLRKRQAAEAAILDAFKSIIDHMEFSEVEITNVLQELKAFGSQHALGTSVHQHCLEEVLKRQSTAPELIQKLILSLIYHLAKDENHTRAINFLELAFTSVRDADIELPSVPTTACLSLLWQQGGRQYNSKKWSEAADWYLAGSHKLFRTNSPSTTAKCFRKAALCYIEQRDYAQASAVIRRCPMNEASTLYVVFVISIRQGLENEAIHAVRDMLNASDFDRRMLLLATQISYQSEMKPVLLAVLESLLKTLKAESNGDCISEAMTLVRCIVKLILGLLVQPAAHRPPLIDSVVRQFQKALALTEAAVIQKATPVVWKDVSWLWRTAYNCAVQGCSEWEGAGEQISELFDISRELLEACSRASPVSIDADACLHLANASFAAVSGRVFATRETMANNGTCDEPHLSKLLGEIRSAKTRISDVMGKEVMQGVQDCQRIEYFLHALRVFEVEFSVHLKAWDEVSHVVEEVAQSGPAAIGTFEAIADILWLDQACPPNVLSQCLDAILRSSLDHKCCSIEKFSRWLRTISTIGLSRNTDADRTKTIGYFEQAVSVLADASQSDVGDEVYPMDERQWLLSTAFETGCECLQFVQSCTRRSVYVNYSRRSSNLDEAKRWFETATIMCRYVPAGHDRAAKISEAYSSLLSHYQTQG